MLKNEVFFPLYFPAFSDPITIRRGIAKKSETDWISLSIPPCALMASSIVVLAQSSLEFGTSFFTRLAAWLSIPVVILSGFWNNSLLLDSTTSLAMLDARVVDSLSMSTIALPINSSIWMGVDILLICFAGCLLNIRSLFILSVMHITLCIACLNLSVLGKISLNISEVSKLP